MSVDQLLADPSIAIIVNLTIPTAHASVTRSILEAGKHAYSEKPFVLTLAEGEELRALCESTGLRIGSAPDTFLGGAHQTARQAIDEGAVGRIASGTCHVMSHGMEHWHPNPDFFYQPGAGPVLDLGPYYITNLLQLLGPVRQVAALTTAASTHRTISSQPRAGETIPVDTPTTIHALLAFEQGASITLSASWDVWGHRHKPMELYGTDGSLYVPDPNFSVVLSRRSIRQAAPPFFQTVIIPSVSNRKCMGGNRKPTTARQDWPIWSRPSRKIARIAAPSTWRFTRSM